MLSTKSALLVSHWPVQPQLDSIMRARRELFHFNKWNNAIQMRVMHTSAEMMHCSLNGRAAPHRGSVYVSGTPGRECKHMWRTDKREKEGDGERLRSSDGSHERLGRTRPESDAHARSHMPAWLGLIIPRRPSVKQFVRKFSASQMLWRRMMSKRSAAYSSSYSLWGALSAFKTLISSESLLQHLTGALIHLFWL